MKAKIIAGVTAAAVAGSVFAVSAEGTAKYPKDYTIENVLSDYQYFVSGDASIESHTVGALAVGGKGEFGAWGDGQIAPTYVHEIVSYGNFNGGDSNWLTDNDKNNEVYYGICESPNSTFKENDEYIDFSVAMEKIQSQSNGIAAGGVTIPESAANLDHEPWEQCTLTIDVSKYETSSFVIPFVLLDEVTHINFIDSKNPDFGIEDLAKGHYTVSVTGVGDNDIDFFFGWTSTNTGLLINGQTLNNNNSFKNLEGTEQGGQLYTGGMNLIWNFPDAAGVITNDYLAGHMVAPNATVKNEGGNFEGGIIAKNVVSKGEGHFFPYFEPHILNSYDDVLDPATTTTTTSKPTTTTTTTSSTTTTTTSKPTTTTTTTSSTTTTTTSKPTTTTTTTSSTTTTTTSKPTTTTTTTSSTTTTTSSETTTSSKPTTTTTATSDGEGSGSVATSKDVEGNESGSTTTTTVNGEGGDKSTTTTTTADGEGGDKSTTTTTSADGEGGDKSTTTTTKSEGDKSTTTTTAKAADKSTTTTKSKADNANNSKTTAAKAQNENSSKSPATGMRGYVSLSTVALLTGAAAIYLGKKKFDDDDK